RLYHAYSKSALSAAVVSFHFFHAMFAAFIACFASLTVKSATLATVLPFAGLLTSNVFLPLIHFPSINDSVMRRLFVAFILFYFYRRGGILLIFRERLNLTNLNQ